MPRAVDGTRRKDRRKKILDQAKGYYGRRSTNHRIAKDAVAKAGQYAYRGRKEKKSREAKKNQTVVKIKEIRMQPKIEKHDLETKSKAIAEFLGEGNKVKVSVRFRGRELAHPELGKVVLDKILDALTELGVQYNLDKGALMEGKMMSMTVSPQKK